MAASVLAHHLAATRAVLRYGQPGGDPGHEPPGALPPAQHRHGALLNIRHPPRDRSAHYHIRNDYRGGWEYAQDVP